MNKINLRIMKWTGDPAEREPGIYWIATLGETQYQAGPFSTQEEAQADFNRMLAEAGLKQIGVVQ